MFAGGVAGARNGGSAAHVLIPSGELDATGPRSYKQVAVPYNWNTEQMLSFDGLTGVLNETHGFLYVLVVLEEEQAEIEVEVEEETEGAGRSTRNRTNAKRARK